MTLSNAHNLARPSRRVATGRFGIRVSLPDGDPLARLLDSAWHRQHWYRTAAERDAALAEMQRRHEYSRNTDAPALRFDPIERDEQAI